jgi:hypothetical protein
MSQMNGSIDDADRNSLLGDAMCVTERVIRRLVEGAGFWSAVVLPFVAVVLLVARPDGWVLPLFAVVAVNLVGVLAGHCYGREC